MTDGINLEIQNIAMLQFSDEEISIITQIEYEHLIEKHRADIDRGRLIAEAEVRKSISKSANEGNTSAQNQFMSLNAEAKRKTEAKTKSKARLRVT